jgi:hypothetical protein
VLNNSGREAILRNSSLCAKRPVCLFCRCCQFRRLRRKFRGLAGPTRTEFTKPSNTGRIGKDAFLHRHLPAVCETASLRRYFLDHSANRSRSHRRCRDEESRQVLPFRTTLKRCPKHGGVRRSNSLRSLPHRTATHTPDPHLLVQ